MARETILLSLAELCQCTQLSTQSVIEIVEQGIVEPRGDSPESWSFDAQMVVLTKKAQRLYADLEIDWSGIALALYLIEEVERLREDNKRLRRQLGKFVQG
jgi:chaperone modulatory protein CbpM